METVRKKISTLLQLDELKTPGMDYGITSTVPVNGGYEFNLSVKSISADAEIMQVQYNGPEVYMRMYTAYTDTWSIWSLLNGVYTYIYGVPSDEYLTSLAARDLVPLYLRKPGMMITYLTTTAEICVITFTHKADKAGTIFITLDDIVFSVEVTEDETPEEIAAQVYADASSFEGWTLLYTVETAIVTFVKDVIGVVVDPEYADATPIAEIDTLTITSPSTVAGNINVNLDGIDNHLAVLGTETNITLATAIRNMVISGWTSSGTDNDVIFTKDATGECVAPVFSNAIAEAEIDTLTITSAPTADGTITVNLDGVEFEVELVALTHTTTALVAAAIEALTPMGWTSSVSDNVIIFTNEETGVCAAPIFTDTDITGAAGTFVRTNIGITATDAVTTFERTAIGLDITGVTTTISRSIVGGVDGWTMEQFRSQDTSDWFDDTKWITIETK